MRYHTNRVLSFLANNDWVSNFAKENEVEDTLLMINRILELVEEDYEQDIVIEKIKDYK